MRPLGQRDHAQGGYESAERAALERTVTVSGDGNESTHAAGRPSDAARSSAEDRYTIEREFARGGLGRILTARDERLNREVAVKELLSSDYAHRERFQREVEITARLQHPAIVPVHDAGQWANGAPYYVMKLLGSGRTLKDAIDTAADVDTRLALLPNVIAVADAIAYAHSKRIIHRDLKPSNVLVGEFGETVVVDWGLAKDLSRVHQSAESAGPYRSASPDQTVAGVVLGTPAYMPPEQARGELVDETADVYSLGAILYFLLVGQSPYSGADSKEVLREVLAAPPPPLEAQVKGVPEDLATIVRKAMARVPSDRYATAADLAEDLKRFQTGQLVGARQYSRLALAKRWVRRHYLPIAFTGVLLVSIAVVASLSFSRIVRERNAAEASRRALLLNQAQALLDHDPTQSLAWLKKYPDDGPGWNDVQDLAADAHSRGIASRVLVAHKDGVGFALSPNGQLFATTGGTDLKIWNATTATLLRSIAAEENLVVVTFSPDDRFIAASGFGGAILLYDVLGGTTRILRGHSDITKSLSFSHDSRFLLSANCDRTARVWDLDSGRSIVLRGHRDGIAAAAFAADDQLAITAGFDGQVGAWDPATGSGRLVRGHDQGIHTFSLAPDGIHFATGGFDHVIRIWDARTLTSLILGRTDGAVRALAWSTDGSSVISPDYDSNLFVWSMADHRRRTFKGPTNLINSIALSPVDAASFATFDMDGAVWVWDLRTGLGQLLQGHTNAVNRGAFTPDGTALISTSRDGTVRFWRINPPIRVFHSPGAVYHVPFSPSSELIAADGDDFIVRVWDGAGVERKLVGHSSIVFGVAFVDEQHVVSTGVDGSVRWWELPGGSATAWTGERSRPEVLALSSHRDYAAIGYHDGALHVFDTRTHRETLTAKLEGAILAAAWSSRGNLLAVGGDSHTVTIWNVDGDRREVQIDGLVTALVFSPDGERVTAGSSDGWLTTAALSSGRISRVRPHSKAIVAVRYSPDGSLVTASDDGTVRLDRDGRSDLVLQFDDRVRSLAVSADALIAAASNDHTVRIRDLRSGALSVLRGDKRTIRSVEFSPLGALAYGSEDGNVRVVQRNDLRWTPRGREALQQWLSQETGAQEVFQRKP